MPEGEVCPRAKYSMPEGEVLKCWGVPEASVGGRLRHDSLVGLRLLGGSAWLEGCRLGYRLCVGVEGGGLFHSCGDVKFRGVRLL